MRPVQHFSDEYLDQCRDMTADQIIRFLEDFRQLHGNNMTSGTKLISIKVPVALLNVFRTKAARKDIPYQTKIKSLMKDWVLHGD